MTDHDKNMRTLIVSFVVAMMVMVPLRFVEATQQTLEATNRILGEMTEATPNNVQREIVPMVKADNGLEAPYNEIEKKIVCVSTEQAAKQVKAVINKYGGDLNNLNERLSTALYAEIERIDKSICK